MESDLSCSMEGIESSDTWEASISSCNCLRIRAHDSLISHAYLAICMLYCRVVSVMEEMRRDDCSGVSFIEFLARWGELSSRDAMVSMKTPVYNDSTKLKWKC